MAIANGVEILVSADSLIASAGKLKEKIMRAEASYNTVMEIVRNTNRYWIGQAGDEHRSAFLDQQDDIDQILVRLKEHPDDLLKIAGVYVKAEEKTATITSAPMTDLIL